MKTRTIGVLSAALVGASALSACSHQQPLGEPALQVADQAAAPLAEESAVDEDRPGFYLSGEFVAFEKFDPLDEGLNTINPCEEIPREFLLEVGMVEGAIFSESLWNASECRSVLGDLDSVYDLVILGAPVSREQLEQKEPGIGGPFMVGDWSPIDGGIRYVFYQNDINGPHCGIGAETSRGELAVIVEKIDFSENAVDLCPLAEEKFNQLYQLLRGRN